MSRTICIVAAGLAALLAGSAACGVRWNLSASAAPGLYLERARPIKRGDLVSVCLPEPVARWARGRGYLHRGGCPGDTAPLGKRIGALAGDRLEVGHDGISVNGNLLEGSRRVSHDLRGRPIPLIPEGEYELGAGEVWLHSSRHPRSLDSRLLGALKTSQIRGTLIPLWVPKD